MKTNNKYRVYTMPDGMDCKIESLERAVELFVLTFQSPYENEVRLAKLDGSGFTGAEFDDIDIELLEKFTALTGGLVSDGELVVVGEGKTTLKTLCNMLVKDITTFDRGYIVYRDIDTDTISSISIVNVKTYRRNGSFKKFHKKYHIRFADGTFVYVSAGGFKTIKAALSSCVKLNAEKTHDHAVKDNRDVQAVNWTYSVVKL